jgi:hypothetical protein
MKITDPIIIEKIKNSHYHKFSGIAPEGFMLVPIEVLDKLKIQEIWKTWVDDEKFLEKLIIDYCNKFNL